MFVPNKALVPQNITSKHQTVDKYHQISANYVDCEAINGNRPRCKNENFIFYVPIYFIL